MLLYESVLTEDDGRVDMMTFAAVDQTEIMKGRDGEDHVSVELGHFIRYFHALAYDHYDMILAVGFVKRTVSRNYLPSDITGKLFADTLKRMTQFIIHCFH